MIMRVKSTVNTFFLLRICLFLSLLFSCSPATDEPGNRKKALIKSHDPLPSWREGSTKESIVDFVREVTDTKSPYCIEPSERIAVFDNDGTLWSEKPFYFQFFFAIDRVNDLLPKHPEWKNEQPFQAVLEKDWEALARMGEPALLKLIMATHAGNTTEEFENIVLYWLSEARHPRFGRHYTELVYQPMLELIYYLQNNSFKVYIISGGGIEFMRVWSEEVYGIPPENVLGSSIKTKFRLKAGKPEIVRLPEIDFIDDKEGKPVGIQKFIGRKPVLAVGNSDGDLQMLQWTASGEGKRLMLYLHHTDSAREWAYDKDSFVGRLDKGLTEAQKKGWTVIDMAKDWEVVYPFEVN